MAQLLPRVKWGQAERGMGSEKESDMPARQLTSADMLGQARNGH